MDKTELMAKYNAKKTQFENLITLVKFEIARAIQREKIEYHSLIYNIKPFDSFIEKIERKKAENPFWDIKDVVRFRVVCYFRRDVKNVGAIIEKLFEIIEKDDKIKGVDIKVFGYMALQYKAQLKNRDQEDENYEQLKKIPFEVQVRTITQDAWASISHYLGYKKETDIPEYLWRDFNALSGLFYVADTHFEIVSQNEFDYRKSKYGID